MLTYAMPKVGKGRKRSVLMVLDPDDVDRMKQGKPIAVDLAQDPRNATPVVVVVGFTPDRLALQKELDSSPNGRGKVNARELLETLTRLQDLPERRVKQ